MLPRPNLEIIARTAMADTPNWILWRYMGSATGKMRKQPVSLKAPDVALKAWQRTSNSFGACAALLQGLWERNPGVNLWGLGYNFNVPSTFVGLDWDAPVSENWSPLQSLTYVETSPSGKGVHAWFQIEGPVPESRKLKTHPWSSVELFGRTGFMTVTGHGTLRTVQQLTPAVLLDWIGASTPPSSSGLIAGSEAEIEALRAAGFDLTDQTGKEGLSPDRSDDDVRERARTAQNAAKFNKLWAGKTFDYADDHSAADLALVTILMYHTRLNRDQTDRLFRQSGLSRSKWTERVDYRERTMNAAQATVLADKPDEERPYKGPPV